MNEKLEKLWNEYLAEKCAEIDTEEERLLAKKAAKAHQIANDLLTDSQIDALEKYVDTLCDIQDAFVKKAFFKGCEFAITFLFELRNIGKSL